MLEKVEYIFPRNDKNIELFELFFILFKDIKYVTNLKNEEIHIGASNLKPETVFTLDNNINDIQLNIGNQKYLNLLNRSSNFENIYEVKRLSIKEIAKKLEGHIIRIDHTGVNLPTNLYSEEEWNDLIKYFASNSNIYNYPTGELWPFLIPSTIEENKNEIINFEIVREPKFELCYEDYESNITLQIDMETDLSKAEVESLFPKNQGIYFETLENVYKAIYLDYSEYINIRFDIRFKCKRGDFESGEWLVSEGKRI